MTPPRAPGPTHRPPAHRCEQHPRPNAPRILRPGIRVAWAVVILLCVVCASMAPAPAGAAPTGPAQVTADVRATGVARALEHVLATGQTPTGSGSPRITILSQSSWVSPTGTFELALDIQGASDTDLLDLAVFPRITRREQFDQSIQGQELGRPLSSDIHPFPLSAYPPASETDGATGIQVTIPVGNDERPPLDRETTRLHSINRT